MGLIGGGSALVGVVAICRRLSSPSISQLRTISTSPVCHLKEIIEKEEENKIVIEGRYIPSPRSQNLVPWAKSSSSSTTPTNTPCPCPLCKLGLYITHRDVLILNQFADSKGKQLPKEVTGLCKRQFRRVGYLLVMAEKSGLMERKDKKGEKRLLVGWESFNKYYDDALIEEFLNYSTRRNRI